MKHVTGDKGDIGVAKAIGDLITKGFMVLTPIASTAPFDLVAYKNNKFLKIQVKYRTINKRGVIEAKLRRSIITNFYVKTRKMLPSECDVLCIYCPDTGKCYYIKRDSFDETVILRLNPTKNNQKRGVKLAFDYENLI